VSGTAKHAVAREQTPIQAARYTPQRMAAELSLRFQSMERGGLEALRGYRLGAADQSFFLMAIHGNPARPVVRRRSSLSSRGPTCGGLREESARDAGLDHAIGESHRHLRLRHA